MHSKITWYEEILGQDPASPLFYHLAQLYLEGQERDKAIHVLRAGLDRHPAHGPARLLLVQTLVEDERLEEAGEHLDAVLAPLTACPAFWDLWAWRLLDQKHFDQALAVRFIRACLADPETSWQDVLHRGLQEIDVQDHMVSPGTGSSSSPDVSRYADAAEQAGDTPNEHADGEVVSTVGQTGSGDGAEWAEQLSMGGYRTLTMADILTGQGDYQAALEIYTELLAHESDPGRRQQIQERIASVQQRASEGIPEDQDPSPEQPAPAGRQKKEELLRRLDTLAARLESKE